MNKSPIKKFSKDNQPLKKRGKEAITKLKEAIGIDRMTATIEQIEENINYFIMHKDERIRLEATKAFVDYYKPKKKDISIEGNIGISLNVSLSGIDESKLKMMFTKK